jgi:hypothetical protein
MCEFLAKTFTDAPTFWVMATALGTFILAYVAWKQLSDLARTSQSDFLYRLKRDFFSEETRKLIFLLDNDLLEFHKGAIAYFRILRHKTDDTESRLNDLDIKGDTLSTHVMDDFLIGPLEDVAILEDRKRVTLEDVYEIFDYYISLCTEKQPVLDYVKWVREELPENEDIYDNLFRLHDKLKKKGPELRKKKSQG